MECSFVFFFELIDFPGKFPRISAGISLLSCIHSWRSVLKFHSVGTSLTRIFDLYFTKRRTFIFSDVCLTQCSPCPNTLVPFAEIAADSGGSVSCDTQINCRTFFTKTTVLLSSSFFGFLFGCSSTFQCGNEHSAPQLTSRFSFQQLTFGRVNTHKAIWCKYLSREVSTRRSIELLRLPSASSISFFSTHVYLVFLENCGSECGAASDAGFVRSLLGLLSNTALFLSTGNKIPVPL